MKRRDRLDYEAAEWVAINGLTFLASDPARLGRFLALTGIGPAEIAANKDEPRFLAGVLEYLLGDEPLLLEFAANNEVPADRVEVAWDIISLEAAKRARS